MRARELNEDLSVSNSSSFEPRSSGNGPSSRVSSYDKRNPPSARTPEGGLRRYRLPPLQKADVKTGKGLMSPSAGAHCECSREETRARLASCYASLCRCSATCVRGCVVLSSGKVILMIPSLAARRDTCMVVLARQRSAA